MSPDEIDAWIGELIELSPAHAASARKRCHAEARGCLPELSRQRSLAW